MSDLLHEKLSGAIRKSNDGERYEFGFVVDGAFVAFSSQQANAYEDDLAEAQEKASEEAAAAKAKK